MSSPHYDLAARLVASPDATPEELHDAAVGLREAFVRAEHMVGLLPGDAVDVMLRAFHESGARGHAPALVALGDLYARGGIAPWATFPAQDIPAALSLYRAADAQGSEEGAHGWVRTAYFARDEAHALAAASRLGELRAADPEDAETMLFLGYFLRIGYGFAADPAAAIRWFEAAATRGDAAAAFELSVLYSTGQDVPQDAEAGLAWTVRAAELGSDRAQANLGGMYATGRGVAKDATAAVHWYRRAGESGNARAAFVAGVMLLTGDEGLAPDPVAASEQFTAAEELGYDVDEALEPMGLSRPVG